MKILKRYIMLLFMLAANICGIFLASKVGVHGNVNIGQEVKAAENGTLAVATGATATISSALVKADCTHIFYDYGYKNPVKDNIVIYANGGIVREGEQKTSYKTKVLYTDILASYSYKVNAKGTVKAATGKVITGFTVSPQLPVLAKGKIVDKEAQKTAKAKIKNGQVTVTAQKIPGLVYLWVIDTGSQGVYECCPVNVMAAPSRINIYDRPDDGSGFSSSTKQYKKDNIEVGNAARIYLYPYYKDGNANKKAGDARFSATGTTQTVAKRITDVTGADLYEIEPQERYTSADLNYNNPVSRVVKEHENPSIRPAIGSSKVNLDDYEVIFLGYL